MTLVGSGICLGGIVGVGMWVYSLLFPSWGNPLLQKKEPPAWSGEHIQVDVSPYLPQIREFEVHLEFAAKNEPYLLVWSLDWRNFYPTPLYKYVKIAPGTHTVIDFHGNVIEEATNEQRELLPPYMAMFPKTSYRQTHAEFIRDADHWAFSADEMYGMKSGRCSREPLSSFCPVQVWDLARHKLLWEAEYEGRSIDFAKFLSWEGTNCLLIASDRGVSFVSQKNGDILGGFHYLVSEEQAFPLAEGNFYPSSLGFAYNAAKRWLACGEFEGRRVRIYSIDPPYPLLREISTDIPPHPPLGGGWLVRGVDVNGNGKYLTVQYGYSGKWIETTCYPTEVYDTDTWELVWYENKKEVHEVTVSPNGKKIVFLRGNVLELGDFTPTNAE